jgi:oxygen-dependent protoporphyrinogen oxidase
MVGSHEHDGFTTEIGPVGVLDADLGAVPLARELGVPVVQADPEAGRRWVVRDGHLRPLPSGPLGVLNGDHVSPWRALTAALEPWRPVGQEVDESVHAFLARRFGRGIADAFSEVALVGITAGDPHTTSATAMFPAWRTLERSHGSLLRGLRAKRTSGAPPRRLHAFGAGNMAALASGLYDQVQADVHLGRAVQRLDRRGDRWFATDAAGQEVAFSHVLLTISAPAAGELLAGVDGVLADLLKSVSYAPMRVVGLGYRREDVPHALNGYGFLVPKQPLVRSLGVLFSSSLFPNQAPSGHVHVRVLMGGVRDPEAVTLSDPDALQAAQRDLHVTLGVHAAPVHRHQVRWHAAIPQYPIGHPAWVSNVKERASNLPGLALCGGAYGGGVGVNDAVRGAEETITAWTQSPAGA